MLRGKVYGTFDMAFLFVTGCIARKTGLFEKGSMMRLRTVYSDLFSYLTKYKSGDMKDDA